MENDGKMFEEKHESIHIQSQESLKRVETPVGYVKISVGFEGGH